MADLNLDLHFFQHPKTVRLVGRLGKGAEVLLIRLWCHCGVHHCEDGKLSGYSPSEIETAVSWWGKPGEMVAAMLGLRWLEQDVDGNYLVHDWVEHQGHIAAMKAKGRAMAMARWNSIGNASRNAVSIAEHPPPAILRPSVPTNQKPPSPGAREGCEVPDKTQAIAQAGIAGVVPAFAGFVFDDWAGRGGKDAANCDRRWLEYVKTRWERERKEWTNGTHKGNRSNSRAGVDRNAGTANAGKSSQYAGVGKLGWVRGQGQAGDKSAT